jgi:hypothetical protein
MNKYKQANEQNIGDNDQDSEALKNKEIIVTFPEKEVRISKKEFMVFAPFHENEQIMRLLTGQLTGIDPNQQPMQAQVPQNQNDLLAKLMQANPNLVNMGGLAGMQNLMNNPMFGNMGGNYPSTNNSLVSSMMTSMMGMGNQGQNPLFGMNQNMQSQMSPTNMNSNMAQNNQNWNTMQGGLNGMVGNMGNLDKQSLNELGMEALLCNSINNQMKNFNNTPFMGQEGNQNNLDMNAQNTQYNSNGRNK